MKAFKGLFYKEIKLSKNWFMIGIILLIFIVMAGLGLAGYFNEPNIFAVISFLVLIAHAFYLPAYLLTSFNIEGQTQLWLHNPNSGAKLFLAKLASGFVFFLISVFIALLIAIWGIKNAVNAESFLGFEGDIFPNIALIGLALTLSSIFLGVWMMFYWSLFHSLKNIPVASSFRWPILIGVWVLLTTAGNYIQNLPFYQKLQKIGVFKLDTVNSIKFEAEAGKTSASAGFVETAEISIMNGIIYTVIVIIVFYIAVWLFERKVEV